MSDLKQSLFKDRCDCATKQSAAARSHTRSRMSHALLRSVALAALLFAAATAFADCTTVPCVTVFLETNSKTLVASISYDGGDPNVHTWDFYQFRWSREDGPQSQSPRINTNVSSFYVNNIDTGSYYGFIGQACRNRPLQPAACTAWSPIIYFKPFGPDQCRFPYVWREANSADHVCVKPKERQATADENAVGQNYVAPTKGLSDGTCIQGYVWREANSTDHVCVDPPERDRTARQNRLAASRRLP